MIDGLCPGDHLLSCLSLDCSVDHSRQTVLSILFVLGIPHCPSSWEGLNEIHQYLLTVPHSVSYVQVWHLENIMSFHSGDVMVSTHPSSYESLPFKEVEILSFFKNSLKPFKNVIVLCSIFRIMFFSFFV